MNRDQVEQAYIDGSMEGSPIDRDGNRAEVEARDWIDDLPGITSVQGVRFGELMVPVSAVRTHYAILARPAPPSEGLRKALGRIAAMTGDMPAAVNDEAGWYRRQFYAAVGIASRAFMVTPADPAPPSDPDLPRQAEVDAIVAAVHTGSAAYILDAIAAYAVAVRTDERVIVMESYSRLSVDIDAAHSEPRPAPRSDESCAGDPSHQYHSHDDDPLEPAPPSDGLDELIERIDKTCDICGGDRFTVTADPLPSGEPDEPYQVQCPRPLHDEVEALRAALAPVRTERRVTP